METTLQTFVRKLLHLAVAPLGLLLCQAMQAAVTFTVTPDAVSNTYQGVITLQVKGLTNTEAVVVQKFMDLNGNGVIDAGAWLVQQFQLTDGRAGMIIGGVVNSNVPGDTDATAGQITAPLNFLNGGFNQNFAGKYLYKLSSPAGRFTPITNRFTVTTFPYAQKFTGKVLVSGAGTAVPNAVVILQNGTGVAVGSAVADSSGGYTVPAPPGTYALAAFKGGYVFQYPQQGGPALVLSSGQTVTTNLAMASATASISGKMVDANDSSSGLPGILLSAQSTNGLMGVGVTDTNGNFTVGVQSGPGQWGLKTDDTSLIAYGYLGLQGRTDANAGQTGITLAVPKATALFYGSVKDNLGNPLPGIDVYVNDSNDNLYQADGYTDANGNYTAAALGGLNNDPWQVQISSDAGPANYLFSQPAFDQNGGANLSDGQAVPANFTALLATEQISGFLKDSSGNPIAGVGVYAYATINGAQYDQYVDTDGNGNYSLSVANGDWTVGVNCSGGSDSLDSLLGSGNYQCPNNQNVTINDNNGAASFTVSQSQGGSGQIAGYVKDTGGSPVAGVTVYANGGNGQNYSTTTDPNGHYSFNNVGNGDWDVSVDCGGLNSLGYQCVGDQHVNVSSGSVEQDFTVQSSSRSLQITNVSLAAGTAGVPYSAQLGAIGGQPPYGWALALASAGLPAGLTLNSAGLISGTPTNNTVSTFRVEATDANMAIAYQILSITINLRPALGSPSWVGNQFQMRLTGAAGQNYTVQMSTSLSWPNWTSLFVTNSATASSFVVTDPTATDKQRFYRVQAGP